MTGIGNLQKPVLLHPAGKPDERSLLHKFISVRAHSVALAAPLSAEDQNIQSMPDASPTKWHLAHTSWFFEAMILQAFIAAYEAFDAALRIYLIPIMRASVRGIRARSAAC